MEHVHIAALRPNLDAPESKQIKAVVTLIWPYSSSRRQFALLLAEPDFRLRRRNGQVRARFCSTSARALATTGVGIGDEVVLSLHGAQFVQDGAVSTPGKSIDWELVYTQTVAISVRRNGAEIANLELIDAAPTPAPRSPVKKPAPALSPIPQWSSPAFLKRARLSNGPFFEQPAYDPLADESYDGHDKKRRRKSYRDWSAWTYTTRTPSPEKEGAASEDEPDEPLSSPSRPPQLPKTPVSPSGTEPTSVAAGPADESDYVEETTIADSAEGDTTVDDGELQKVHVPWSTSPERPKGDGHDGNYYHLHDGPQEVLPDSQYDFGGDTELNTEDEDEHVTVPDAAGVDASTNGVATALEDESQRASDKSAAVALQPVIEVANLVDADAASATEEDTDLEVIEADHLEGVSIEVEDTTIDETVPEVPEPAVVVDESVAITMPPPSLPALHTDFAMTSATDLLTPIGMEPSSPNLKAVDSATLPLPSPFPGEQATSYFEDASGQHQVPLDGPPIQGEPELESDADYILENSFFSSINSSRAGGLHQDHETAFTPVRFTFGTDGTGWSRPLELSSPPPEAAQTDTADGKDVSTASLDLDAIDTKTLASVTILEQPQRGEEVAGSSSAEVLEDAASMQRSPTETKNSKLDIVQPSPEPALAGTIDAGPATKSPNVVLLSSDVESDQSEHEDEVMAEPEDEVMVELEEEQSSEEETESESEDEVEPSNEVSEAEAESGGDEVDAEQAMPGDSQPRTEPGTTIDIVSTAGNDQPRTQEDVSFGNQAPAIVAETVDLDSPSAGESSDNEVLDVVVQRDFVQAGHAINAAESHNQLGAVGNVHRDDLDLRVGLTNKSTAGTAPDDFENSIGVDIEQEHAEDISPGPDQPIREPASIATPSTYEKPLTVEFDDREPRLGMDEPLPSVKDHDSVNARVEHADAQVDTEHPDIKMESVEDGSLYPTSQPETQDVPQESGTDPATELLTSVSESGNKTVELQFKSVPATAPARNTRSKTKSATSPTEEDGYMSRLSTNVRRTRSKASFDSTNRESISPTHARGYPGSTASPTLDAPQMSPYSLRSQSKHMSPDNVASSQSNPVRRSPRKLARRDTDFDIVSSQAENRDGFGSVFEPSQELGFGYSQLSQGRFSDVGFVKDSEEDPSHSEGSISTVQDSDTAEVVDDVQPATPRSKPPPAGVSQTQRQTRSRSRSVGQQGILESPSQPQHSPRRSPRLTRSTFSATPSPRIARTTREPVQVSVPDVVGEDKRDEATKSSDQQSIIYPILPIEGEDNIQSSPAAPASAQQPPQHESNLMTPGDTQQTVLEPPLSFQARQPEQSLITPELTQTASASATLRSFDIPLPGVQTQPAPLSPVLRTSPRHKPAVAEVRSSSPAQQSSDAVSSPDADVASAQKQELLPSIGLSTPLAYYTPLRDLIFFLNRSSQFHSGSYPDILALCTAPSTAPTKAKKGPRHWTSTLHVTDLSVWPETRTVNVFRPYRNALPAADAGDVILLRAFAVESRERQPLLRSQDESAWCVWRFGKPVWGAKKGKFGELRAREEVKGPVVERGVGEWAEVERLRSWFLHSVRGELERLREERETKENGDANETRVEEVEGGE